MNKKSRLLWTGILSFFLLLDVLIGIELFYKPCDQGSLFVSKYDQIIHVNDFVIIYNAGYLAISPQRFDVYDRQVQLASVNKLIAPEHISEAFYLQYVPFAFALLAPLALLPMSAAYFVWSIFSLLLGATTIIYFLRSWCKWELRYAALFVLALFTSLPSILGLHIGQFSWINLALWTFYFWGLLSGKNIAAGICLALSAIKPQYLPVLLMPAYAWRKWKLLLIFVVSEILLLAIATLFIGWKNVLFYPSLVHAAEANSSYIGIAPESMTCIRSVLTMIFGNSLALDLNYCLMLAAMVGIYWLWLDGVKRNEAAHRWLVAITVLTVLIFSPHSHLHDCLLLAIAAMFTARQKVYDAHSKKSALTYLWFALLYAYPIYDLFLYGLGRVSFFFVNAILLLIGLAYYWRYCRNLPDNSSAA